MKRIGITQRVDHISSYGEYRSALDQRWIDFTFALNYFPVPLPIVSPENIDSLYEALNLDAVLLSGGNSLSVLDPSADDASPKRDEFERALIDGALIRGLPIVGVCRGMQLLNHFFGGELVKVNGHVAVRHVVSATAIGDDACVVSGEVNSFHSWGIPPQGLAVHLNSLAVDESGNIEAFKHQNNRVLGLMWHPEREASFVAEDINLIKAILK